MTDRLREALRPFADFADPRGVVPADFVITQGSSMAKRQLTMGDCYEALAALAVVPAQAAPVIDDHYPDASFEMRRGWEAAIRELLGDP